MVSADTVRTVVGILGEIKLAMMPSRNTIFRYTPEIDLYEEIPLTSDLSRNAIALGLLLSPVPTFVTICKKKSVEQFSAAPYLSTLFNCMLWVVYGLPWVHPHSVLVLTINGSGLVIQLTYVLLFLTYSEGRKRLRVLVVLLAEVAFVAAVAVFVLTLAHTHQRRTVVVGSFCVIFGALMHAAPLSIMISGLGQAKIVHTCDGDTSANSSPPQLTGTIGYRANVVHKL